MNTPTTPKANPSDEQSTSTKSPADTETRKMSEAYSDASADVELISIDNTVFRVHSYQLMAARYDVPTPPAFASGTTSRTLGIEAGSDLLPLLNCWKALTRSIVFRDMLKASAVGSRTSITIPLTCPDLEKVTGVGDFLHLIHGKETMLILCDYKSGKRLISLLDK